MSQYPPQDPNYPYQGGQSGPYGAPDPYGQPAQPQYPQQPAYPGYPQTPQPQYPQTPQPQYPSYGAPGQAAPYGAPTPQSQYGYPQGQPSAPGFPGGPGLPPAPSSNRGTITGIAIAAVVVVLVVVGVFVLRNLTGASFAGQWYGPLSFSPASGTSYQAYTAEVYLNLAQNTSSLTGNGNICVNLNGTVQKVPISNLSGTINGSTATFALTGGSTNESVTLTLSGSSMSFNSTDNTGTTTGTLQNGGSNAQSNYDSACQALPPLQTAG